MGVGFVDGAEVRTNALELFNGKGGSARSMSRAIMAKKDFFPADASSLSEWNRFLEQLEGGRPSSDDSDVSANPSPVRESQEIIPEEVIIENPEPDYSAIQNIRLKDGKLFNEGPFFQEWFKKYSEKYKKTSTLVGLIWPNFMDNSSDILGEFLIIDSIGYDGYLKLNQKKCPYNEAERVILINAFLAYINELEKVIDSKELLGNFSKEMLLDFLEKDKWTEYLDFIIFGKSVWDHLMNDPERIEVFCSLLPQLEMGYLKNPFFFEKFQSRLESFLSGQYCPSECELALLHLFLTENKLFDFSKNKSPWLRLHVERVLNADLSMRFNHDLFDKVLYWLFSDQFGSEYFIRNDSGMWAAKVTQQMFFKKRRPVLSGMEDSIFYNLTIPVDGDISSPLGYFWTNAPGLFKKLEQPWLYDSCLNGASPFLNLCCAGKNKFVILEGLLSNAERPYQVSAKSLERIYSGFFSERNGSPLYFSSLSEAGQMFLKNALDHHESLYAEVDPGSLFKIFSSRMDGRIARGSPAFFFLRQRVGRIIFKNFLEKNELFFSVPEKKWQELLVDVADGEGPGICCLTQDRVGLDILRILLTKKKGIFNEEMGSAWTRLSSKFSALELLIRGKGGCEFLKELIDLHPIFFCKCIPKIFWEQRLLSGNESMVDFLEQNEAGRDVLAVLRAAWAEQALSVFAAPAVRFGAKSVLPESVLPESVSPDSVLPRSRLAKRKSNK